MALRRPVDGGRLLCCRGRRWRHVVLRSGRARHIYGQNVLNAAKHLHGRTPAVHPRIGGEHENIPAVIKADDDKYDQVNENDGREGLSTRDQSRFISRCLQEGDAIGYIAERLRINKSAITELLAFQKLPEEIINTLYETGIVTTQGPLYQLYLCYRLDKRKTLNYCNKIAKQGVPVSGP